jgi:hypothetical protein
MLVPLTPRAVVAEQANGDHSAYDDHDLGSQASEDEHMGAPPRSYSKGSIEIEPPEAHEDDSSSDSELPIKAVKRLAIGDDSPLAPTEGLKSPGLPPAGVIPPRLDSLNMERKAKNKAAPHGSPVPAIVTGHVAASAMEISMAHATMRKHIVRELVSSEQKYCDNLRFLCQEYADRVQALQCLSEEEKIALTGRVQDILSTHQELLDDLEDELAHWNDTSAISGTLRKHIPSLVSYRTYMKSYSRIGLNIAYKQRFQPAIATITQHFNGRVASQGGLWLDSYLLMPIQRLPRIVLMLRDMLKHTPPTWVDSQELAAVVEQLEAVLKSINAEIPQQHTVSLKEMQMLISNYEGGTDCLRCLTPESNMVAGSNLESFKVTKGGKSVGSDDADLQRVVITTSGILVTTQKMEAQRKKMLGRNKSGTIVPDSARKIEVPWYAVWSDCSATLQSSSILVTSSVEAAGSCKMVLDDAEEANKLFKQIRAAGAK